MSNVTSVAEVADSFDWKSLLPALITGVLGIIGVLLTVQHYYRSDKKEIYRERLEQIYLPLYRKMKDFHGITAQNLPVWYSKFERLLKDIDAIFEQQYLNVPEYMIENYQDITDRYLALHNRNSNIDKAKAKKDLLDCFNKLKNSITHEYFAAKNKLGFPKTSLLKQLEFYPRHKQIWIGINFLSFVIALILLIVRPECKFFSYTIVFIVSSVSTIIKLQQDNRYKTINKKQKPTQNKKL